MVSPLGAPEVLDLAHHCLESFVHLLWLFSFVEGESSELSFDHLHLSDLVIFMHHLEGVTNLLHGLQLAYHVVLFSTQRGK
jgi:hypothetical protein